MVPWPGGVEQDFLEVPSMALEKFASEPELLARVARHYSLTRPVITPPHSAVLLQAIGLGGLSSQPAAAASGGLDALWR